MLIQDLPAQLTRYPVVIFGSGPAGYATAMRLAERRIPCLIIEAGSANANARLQNELADHEGSGHIDGTHWRVHSRIGLGGTSAIWNGFCISLEPRDFAEWPVTYAEIEPYYRSAARLLGRSESIIGYRQKWLDDFDLRPLSVASPLRVASPKSGLAASERIHIAQNKVLKRLSMKSGRVSGFTLVDARGKAETRMNVAAHTKVVLALGGIGNAQMLLQPNEDGTPSASARKSATGRYLMDHGHDHDFAGALVLGQSAGLPAPPRTFSGYKPSVINSDRVWEQSGRRGCMFELLPASGALDQAAAKLAARHLTAPKYYNLFARFEMRPNPSNHIRLAGQNPYGIHTAAARCVFAADDLIAVEHALQTLARELGRKGAGFVRIDNAAIYRRSKGQGHIMGATRMGGRAADSVVDRNAKVHELENLYLAGSSIFPTGGAGHATMLIIALAQRLADHLGGKHGN